MNKEEIIQALRLGIKRCKNCELSKVEGIHPVPSVGSVESPMMILGRNCGITENQMLQPFCGAGGRLLNDILGNIGYERKLWYITNLVKCYTIDDEPPKMKHVYSCNQWLDRELRLVRPRLVVLLGKQVINYFIPGGISTFKFSGFIVFNVQYNCWMMPWHHPGWLVRNRNYVDGFYKDTPQRVHLLRLQKHVKEAFDDTLSMGEGLRDI